MCIRDRDRGVRGVDGDSDSDRRKGSFCDGSESEEEGEGAEEISDRIARSDASCKGKGRKQKRSNSVAYNVSSGPVTASKSTRERSGRRTCACATSDLA